MNDVNPIKPFQFYCQPIIPLVYDESLSYYETLCKVVGQLNTTGETVNKLNEGLTGEISERQAADAALDERLKKVEETYKSIHFLVFDGANPNSIMPTRDELFQWVKNGDAIFTLFSTNESGRGQVYAASCTYNAGHWDSGASTDFNIIVPIETSYDSVNDYAVRQKVAKLTIPSFSKPSLSVPWDLQIIEINTPSTTAEGVVNFIATVNDSGAVNASLTPSEFLQFYNMTRGGKNLCVGVNAKLAYDGISRSSSIATVDTTNRIVRIAFERDYGTAITNGVNQLNKTFDYIIGDAKTGTWVHETIDSKVFDFPRYEGFQFTRGANDVITTDDESTPNAVYMQYHSGTSGKIYQNLPTRLIDTVDGAEYWNGTFDVYGNHMTFTFVTSNYATSSGKMLVRVIELSADVNTTAWKYGVKEFTLPIEAADAITYVDFWPTGSETYDSALKGYTVPLASNSTYENILALVKSGKRVVARVYEDAEKTTLRGSSITATVGGEDVSFQFLRAGAEFLGFNSVADYILVSKTSAAASMLMVVCSFILPTPNPDGSDNGKVPTIDGAKWSLKAGGASDAVLYTAQTLTDAQKKQARENVDAASDFVVNGTGYSDNTISLNKTFEQIKEAIDAGKRAILEVAVNGGTYLTLSPIAVGTTAIVFAQAVVDDGTLGGRIVLVDNNGATTNTALAPTLTATGSLLQVEMASDPASAMQIATKQYVDSNTVVDDTMSDTSTNPVQNKVITAALATVVREAYYPITVTATSTEWVVNNGIAYKEASADRTFDNIKAAYDGNKTPVCEFGGMTYSLILTGATEFVFASYRGAVTNDPQYTGLGKYPTSLITINTTGVVISRNAGGLPAVEGADNGKMLIVTGGEWALQRVPGSTVDAELSTTSENPVQNKTVTAALDDKLPRTGGTVTGALRTNNSFSAGGTIAFGKAPIVLSQTADGATEIRSGTADVDDNPPPLSRLKVATPTEDDDAATRAYVNGRNFNPKFKGYVTLSPSNEPLGTGVGLSPSKDGNNYALNISDVNENKPTLLTGVKTPADTDANAAATVEYVLNKAKKAVSIDVVEEEVKAYNYTDIVSEITNGGGNVWLGLGAEQLRMVAWDKTGASSYALTFVNLVDNNFDIHTVTVSPSAATYTYITK